MPQDKILFKSDKEVEPVAKNSRLAGLLEAAWADLEIVQIERIEIGTSKGWRVTYRQ
jgi:hypothetical protein